MLLMSAVVALAGHVTGQVAVAAAVSVAEILPVVQGSALVAGDTRPFPAASEGCPLGIMLMSAVVAQAEHVAGQVAVAAAVSAAVSAAEMLPVVQVSALVEGDTRRSPAASEGCPLGMMLVTVVEAAAVQVVVQMAVQVAVVAAVLTVGQVTGLSCERGDTSPSFRGSVP
ncbi:hypothetical protein NDU88_001844 [Pleurodeles waltl]|uniref:Secreted protein n=1 Tax=Pleurodeles waltl TaxID=8319 RepID=A0AAV7UVD5_PLEWA|nr:hypothetical protein NDU88_001844 [Pleurodeles waltl]